ncbi:hypothetical protein BD560DRAFT_487924 [Blakeslea trispora]|nr:hypothetical protein BD560DRAFT_487924 [Blakeslea trispora]
MTCAKRRASCVFALGRQSEAPSCVNALEDRAEQRLVFSHDSLSEPLCLSLPLKRPDWILIQGRNVRGSIGIQVERLGRNPAKMVGKIVGQKAAKKQTKGRRKAGKKQAEKQNQLSRNGNNFLHFKHLKYHSTSGYSQIQLRVSKILKMVYLDCHIDEPQQTPVITTKQRDASAQSTILQEFRSLEQKTFIVSTQLLKSTVEHFTRVITLLVFTVMLFWDDMYRNEYKGMNTIKRTVSTE